MRIIRLATWASIFVLASAASSVHAQVQWLGGNISVSATLGPMSQSDTSPPNTLNYNKDIAFWGTNGTGVDLPHGESDGYASLVGNTLTFGLYAECRSGGPGGIPSGPSSGQGSLSYAFTLTEPELVTLSAHSFDRPISLFNPALPSLVVSFVPITPDHFFSDTLPAGTYVLSTSTYATGDFGLQASSASGTLQVVPEPHSLLLLLPLFFCRRSRRAD